MSPKSDIAIIGGGVIGLTTAYYLSSEGARVEIVDKGDLGKEASWAGAGILPPVNPEHTRTAFDQLRARSFTLYPTLSAELRAMVGIDNGYTRSGGIELEVANHESEWRAEGIKFESLDAVGLRKLEPSFAQSVERGYFLPEMAQVRNPRHLKALLAACESRGVQLRPGCPVRQFEAAGERVVSAKTDNGPVKADRFMIATGAWTDSLLAGLGFRPGIRPVRGQIALLNMGVPFLRQIVLQGKRYLVPRGDGCVLVGSTEEDAGFDKRNTAGAIADLLSFAVSLIPALVNAKLERSWAGLRPGSPDGMPFLGRVPGFQNLFVAAGHFRAGIELSPATGLVMKELLLGQKPSIPVDSFRLDRTLAS